MRRFDLRLLCLNYMDCRKDIKEIISHAEGKLVVVDSADILLKIYFELVSMKVGEQTEFRIEPYL